MSKGATYKFHPRMKVLTPGTLLRTKIDILGTNAYGVDEDDDEFDFGAEEVSVPAGTICLYGGDEQFIGRDKNTPTSAWVRCQFVAGEKVVHWTLLCVRSRIWEFETYRGKQKLVREALDNAFEIVKEGSVQE